MMQNAYSTMMQAQDLGHPFKAYPHELSTKGYYPMSFSNHGYHMIQGNSHNPLDQTTATNSTSNNDCPSMPPSYYHATAHLHQQYQSHAENIQQNVTSSNEIDRNPQPIQSGLLASGSTVAIKDELVSSDQEDNNSSSSSSVSVPHSKQELGESFSDRIKDFESYSKVPPKKRPHNIPDGQKDEPYWEKRKKNNLSAKRSREARRMKEEQIAIRVVYLEQENLQLRTEVSLLKTEIEKLRCMLYNS